MGSSPGASKVRYFPHKEEYGSMKGIFSVLVLYCSEAWTNGCTKRKFHSLLLMHQNLYLLCPKACYNTPIVKKSSPSVLSNT